MTSSVISFAIFCAVIKPAESSRSLQEETQPGMRRPIQDNGPFALRDYHYYNQGASNEGAVPIFVTTVLCPSRVCFDVFDLKRKTFSLPLLRFTMLV